ncbi:MAG: hypothetical protein M1829_006863 [Trizodia sp. TS-e1964]|nr:MAG: hypothetical protein M1829_006863 [Trizodia sp. TS-e1964]
MDTRNGFGLPQMLQILDKQKKTLALARSFRGQRSSNTPLRNEVILCYTLQQMSRLRFDRHIVHISFVPPAYPPCERGLVTLQKIMVKDLLLETHHWGFYITLRTAVSPCRMTGLMSLADDENQDIITLQLYHQEEE